MQRHLALLLFLFPLPKRRIKEDLDASVYFDRAKQQMAALHERNKERVIQAIEQKNHLQEQVEDLEKMLVNLDSKLAMVEAQGGREQADKLRVVKHDYGQSLGTTKEIFQQAVETCEQIKVAITQEEELIRRQIAEVWAIKAKWRGAQWGDADIQLRMGVEIKEGAAADWGPAAGGAAAGRDRPQDRTGAGRVSAGVGDSPVGLAVEPIPVPRLVPRHPQ